MNRNRRTFVTAVAVVCLFIVLLVVVLRFVGRRGAPKPTPTGPPVATKPGRVLPGAPGPLPELSAKPQPVEINFQGCPAEGDNPRQAELNRLKDRVVGGVYLHVTVDWVEGRAGQQVLASLVHVYWAT